MNAGSIFIVLFGLNLGFVFMNLPPIVDDLRMLYSVSYTGVSVLISALLWTHAALQVPAGMITDRIGVRSALLISVSLLLFGNILAGLIPDLTLALAGRVIAGVGTGLGFVAAMKLLTVIVPAGQTGSYQAYFGATFSFGSVIGYLVVPSLTLLNWRLAHLAPAAVCLVLLAFLPKLPSYGTARRGSSVLPISRLLAMPTAWILGIYHALSFGTVLALGSWIPSLLTESWVQQTAKDLAWAGALMMVISSLARMAGGYVLLKFPARFIAHGSLLVLSVLFAFLCLVKQSDAVLALACLAAIAASVNFGALFYLASQTTASSTLATVFGFVNFLANLGAIVFTLMFGIVKDYTGSFRWGFGLLAIIAVIAVICGLPILLKQQETKQPVEEQTEAS